MEHLALRQFCQISLVSPQKCRMDQWGLSREENAGSVSKRDSQSVLWLKLRKGPLAYNLNEAIRK